MARVYVGIGSNLHQERHILMALIALRVVYGGLDVSSVYASRAIGGCSGVFYNLAVGFDTRETVAQLSRGLREIERRCGRVRDGIHRSRLTLDLDLLLFGDLRGEFAGHRLPRRDLLEQAFVLGPMAEIAGSECHPVTGEYLRDLWARFPRRTQPLRHVAWRDIEDRAAVEPGERSRAPAWQFLSGARDPNAAGAGAAVSGTAA